MRTLADIKRRMTAGTRLEVVEQTKRPVLVGTIRTIADDAVCSRHGARPAGDVQRRCYDWTGNTTETEGSHCTSWPKASQVRILDADTFEYDLPHSNKGHVIRLRFVA
jgi:hypothetical protein